MMRLVVIKKAMDHDLFLIFEMVTCDMSEHMVLDRACALLRITMLCVDCPIPCPSFAIPIWMFKLPSFEVGYLHL